jgi:hypothetical protein
MSASDEELIAAAIEAVGPGETHVVVLARLIVAALRADGRLVDPKISTEGPGSTSPEPGPPACPEYPECSEERLVRDMAASVRAGEPVGRWTSGCAACGTLTKGGTE